MHELMHESFLFLCVCACTCMCVHVLVCVCVRTLVTAEDFALFAELGR